MDKEFSAGGVLSRGGKLMLVRVRNLAGKKVWTFPKGHLEKGETAEQAARREVREETGWDCRVLRPLLISRYRFKKNRRLVSKTVRWYRMKLIKKSGRRDPREILSARWIKPENAERRLEYPSDLRLLEIWKSHG